MGPLEPTKGLYAVTKIAAINLCYYFQRAIQSGRWLNGPVCWNISQPSRTPQKLADMSRFKPLGWVAKTNLNPGLELTYW
jgi:hypothetical protein